REGFAGFVATEATGRRRVIGYAHLSRGSESWAVEYVVHPLWRGEPSLRSDLLAAALNEVAAEGGGHVHVWVPKPSNDDDTVAAGLGLRRGRDLYQMRRPLPVSETHSTVATRPFRPGEDEKVWLEVNNNAFRGHPEQGSWSLQELADREAQPWFDAEGFLLHEIGGTLAAFCWTKVQDDDHGTSEVGEIYVIAVNPNFQRRGLGKELLLAGLEHLSSMGLDESMLYVDKDNAGARSLYRSLGFTDDHVDRAYTGDIEPARSTGTAGR
ncbi:MAG: mycothiol synthase, partial [Acidimicrobiales bacterium]